MKALLNFLKRPLDYFNKLSFNKKLIVVIVIIIILAVLNNTIFAKKESGYITEVVKKATISQTVSETGNIEAGSAVEVLSLATGTITEVFVINKEQVVEGQLLFTVDSSATEQEQQASYANYLTAVATLNAANSTTYSLRSTMLAKWKLFYDLATNSTYEEDNGIPKLDARTAVEFNTSQDDWLAAEAKYKDQQTIAAQAQADISSKWLLYQATQNAEVKAPAVGTVANLALSKGGSIIANENPALVIVNDSQNQFVKVAINEIDIPKIEKEQKVKIEIDAIENTVLDGKVDRVDSVGTNMQGVITYNVYIGILEPNPSIRSGMTATVEIKTETRENVLSVPNSAVKPYQGGRAVQILENGKPNYVPVRVGIKGNDRTEILDGITEDQQIVTGVRNALIQRRGFFGM